MHPAQFQLHAEIEDRHWWFIARRQILSAVIEAVVPPSRENLVIDVGCGTGANLANLAQRYECIGIDASYEAVRLARLRFGELRFVHGLAPRDLAGDIERARLVLVSDVLEHVSDDFALFSELLAATEPGTYFLLTVPADPTLWSQHDRSFGHYRRYERERFERIWRGLPVETRFVSPFNARLYPLVKLARQVSRWRGHAHGEAGTDFALPGRLTNDLLARCFAGERHRLARLAAGGHGRPYHAGVSLMALLRREPGPIERRAKPADMPADVYDPASELVTADA